MTRTCILVALLAAFTVPRLARADFLTFDVDLSGIDSTDGDFLRVFGTITLDPDLPAGSAISSSSLQLQFENDPLITMPEIPAADGNVMAALDWRLDGNSLFIDRVTNDSAGLLWLDFGVFYVFQFAAGQNNDHAITIFDLATGEGASVTLLPSGGPDVGVGFQVGTISVPEPAAVGIILPLLLTIVRRRR